MTDARLSLKRCGYYTCPPVYQLNKYIEQGIYTLKNLTVGRNGFGSVSFDGPVIFKDLNFDDIVLINDKEVILYPNEEQKPPVGEGLNCAAEVRLERVWPFDRSTSKRVTDPCTLKEIGFEKKLREANKKCSATFLNYIPETGSWIFKVEHFSKYGYYDTDEEGTEKEEVADKVKQLTKKQVKQPTKEQSQLQTKEKLIEKTIHTKHIVADDASNSHDEAKLLLVSPQLETPPPQARGFTQRKQKFIREHHDEDDVEMEDAYPASSGTISQITDSWLQSTFNVSASLEISQDKIQSMKRAFFPEDKESDEEPDVNPAIGKRSRPSSPLKSIQSGYYEGSEGPKLLRAFHKYNLCLEDEYPAKKMQQTPRKKLQDLVPALSPVETDKPKGPIKHWPQLRSISGLFKTAACGSQMKLQGDNRLTTSVFKCPSRIIPLHKTTAHQIQSRSVRDMNLFKGCSFRVGWGPGNILLVLTTEKSASATPLESKIEDLEKHLQGRSTDDHSKQIVQRLCVRGGRGLSAAGERIAYEKEIRSYLGKHLRVKLKHSKFHQDGNVPGIRSERGSATLAFHDCLRSKEDDCEEKEYAYNVWRLCEALWGSLPEYVPPVNSHHNLMLRKQHLGDWLRSVFRRSVLNKHRGRLYVSESDSDDSYLETIWNLVTGNMIKEACDLARGKGDVFLAILLTQLATSQYVKELVRNQITSWINVGGDGFINRNRLKIFLLLCATPLYNGKEETVNVCENLDWRRIVGLHLWYLTSNVQTIKDAFLMYQNAFRPKEFHNLYAKAPFPPYKEEGYIYDPHETLPPLDLCYHLMNLYCDRFYSMIKMFDPVTHTLDVLDYSLSWLVYTSLDAIGYHHTSEYGAAHIHSSFASQLESYGMWHWAVFVLLHIPDATRRQMAVIHILERNLSSDGDTKYKKKECFVKKILKIPGDWIYRIKADKSFGQGKHHLAVCFLNKARNFSLSHKILMEHLAPSYVVNERYGVLVRLLKPIAVENAKRNCVSNWEKSGNIIWLYLKVMTKINHMLKHPESVDGYLLEGIQGDVIRLCKQLPQLAVSTFMDRLCRIDISQRVFDLIGEFVKLQRDDQMSCRIALFMSTKLPMPDNFRVIERRNFLSCWPEDFKNCKLFT